MQYRFMMFSCFGMVPEYVVLCFDESALTSPGFRDFLGGMTRGVCKHYFLASALVCKIDANRIPCVIIPLDYECKI